MENKYFMAFREFLTGDRHVCDIPVKIFVQKDNLGASGIIYSKQLC